MKFHYLIPFFGGTISLFGAVAGAAYSFPAALVLLIPSAILFWCTYHIRHSQELLDFLRRQADHPTSGPRQDYTDALLRQEMELTILQSQINPHFLYNTLDSIRSEALAGEQTEIAEMTEHLSKFFRYCISGKENIVRLSDELSNIQHYFSIQKYRFGDRIDLRLDIEDEALLEYYLPKLTLQPIVENAISHGVEELTRPGLITISVRGTEKKLYITVSDNGVGMSFEDLAQVNRRLQQEQVALRSRKDLSRHSGIAMVNVNTRIRLCFGNEYGIHFRSIPNEGTDVEVVVPKTDDFRRAEYMRRLSALY